MKRVWFAVLFIVLCVGLAAYEQVYVRNCCERMISILGEAQQFEKEKNSELRDKKIDELQKYWKKHNDFLFVFSESGGLDDLAGHIRSLKEAHNMKSALAETKALVKIYYENEKVSFSNVL